MPFVFDIETNGLLDATTTLHSLVIKDISTGNLYSCTDNSPNYLSIAEGLKILENADCIVGHNIICFDLPALKKLYPDWTPKGAIRDTLVMSRLIYSDLKDREFAWLRSPRKPYIPPNLMGRHSLKAWGYRLSEKKDTFGETSDWSQWSPEMQAYCEQDVAVTVCLWERFSQMNYSEKAIRLEQQFQEIIFQQELNGFPFDYEAATNLYAELCAERDELKTKLQELWPPVDKGDWFIPKVNNKTRGYVKGEKIWRPRIVAFNPASRADIAERLKETYQWRPTEFSKTGEPKIDDEVLQSLPYPEAKQLARYFLIQKRIGQIGEGRQAWLKVAKKEEIVSDNGRTEICKIHGRVTTNGAVTGRCTHHDPNIAQVPAVGVPWGHECRALFYAPDGWRLLGCDASGLELRCLAHYMARYDGGAYAQVILHGDIHWANAQNLGLVPKDMERDKDNEETEYFRNKVAKRFIYAFLYGAGGYKIGTVCGVSPEEKEKYLTDKRTQPLIRRLKERGEPYDDDILAYTLKGTDLKNKFLATLPALDNLIKDVQQTVKARGTLYGIDKRILPVRSQHSALNTLLQSAGALAVKKATCLLWDYLGEAGLSRDVQQVAHIHDEFQLLVREGIEEQVGAIAVRSFQDAGKYFGFRCPLDGEYKVGRNWAETH